MKTIMTAKSRWYDLRKTVMRTVERNPSASISSELIEREMGIGSNAADNDRCALQYFGLIDQVSNRITALGRQWVDDDQYPKVCRAIIEECYPSGTWQAVSPGGQLARLDRAEVNEWLSRAAKMEDPAKNTAFLLMLAQDAGLQPESFDQRGDGKTKARKLQEDESFSMKEVTIQLMVPSDKTAEIWKIIDSLPYRDVTVQIKKTGHSA